MQEARDGAKDFNAEYPDGFPSSVLVTDRLPLYFDVVAGEHQICLAHLLRNLEYLNQLDTGQTWSKRMQELLREAISQRKHRDWEQIDRKGIAERLEKLLEEPLDNLDNEFNRLQKSLLKWSGALFTFLHNSIVSYDNNESEQAIRKAKTKMKVSQCFRSAIGEEAFAVLHSLMDTARKNGQSAYNVIKAITKPKVMEEYSCKFVLG